MDAAEYKHVVLGLVFLKYISDAFEELRQKLVAGEDEFEGADPEDRDEYLAKNVFWVRKQARWQHLQNNGKQPNIGKLIDDAMDAIETVDPRLKGTLTKNYARESPDKQQLTLNFGPILWNCFARQNASITPPSPGSLEGVTPPFPARP